ncbi:MAG: hypothetical protein WC393_03380 [Candidatus Nanoarchaeia archaeon]|jgi:hypothetical protein
MNAKYFLILLVLFSGCSQKQEYPVIDRLSVIPAEAVKMNSTSDIYPPILYSDEYYEPVALDFPVNTAGAEDSPFIPYDSDDLYFFFTPDVRVPINEQLFDNVTGLYVSHKLGNTWSEPKRIWLNSPGKASLDGCYFIQNDTLWFCSAREGITGMKWFTAKYAGNDTWVDWQSAGFPDSYEVGELHISADGNTMYYHSAKSGGKGGYDLWRTELVNGSWAEPINVEELNTEFTEGWPYLSKDGLELWFLRVYQGTPAVMKSVWNGTGWGEPELVVSQFAGEPTFDKEGNLYFIHHYYNNNTMIEADIYVAYKK